MQIRTALAALTLASVSLIAAACTPSSEVDAEGGQGFIAGAGTAQVIAPEDRVAAPQVAGTTLQGKPLELADFQGEVVVLNVWASWCGPCRQEAQFLQEVYEDNKKADVQFVGINTRDDVPRAKAFEREFGVTYPSFVDESGEIQLAFQESLPFESIPSTLVIDGDGNVAARVLGPTTYTQLSDLVDEISVAS